MTQLDTRNPPGDSELTVPVGRVVVWCLAILSVAGAVLHFAVASENFRAHWSFGVLMLVAAWLQVMWASRCRPWDPPSACQSSSACSCRAW